VARSEKLVAEAGNSSGTQMKRKVRHWKPLPSNGCRFTVFTQERVYMPQHVTRPLFETVVKVGGKLYIHTYFSPPKNNDLRRSWKTKYQLYKAVIREKYMRKCVQCICVGFEFCGQYMPSIPGSCRRVRQPRDELTNRIYSYKPAKSRFALTGQIAEPR
jgi:hypothetical protein